MQQGFLKEFNPKSEIVIDVRSEMEFSKGHLPFAINIPILNNEHRPLVGICFKQKGQAQAIQLGHELVDPIKGQLQARWLSAARGKNLYIYCWRGGLRSNISGLWMREVGLKPAILAGGYKGVRKQVLSQFSLEHKFLVLSGLTGSGKTVFLNKLNQERRIDLEGMAKHRGSAFGGSYKNQPAQQTFENILAFELVRAASPFILEDESRLIGKIKLPDNLFAQMMNRSVVVMEIEIEKRVENIYREYIWDSLLSPSELFQFMSNNLMKIRSRLGGKRFIEVSTLLKKSFAEMNLQLAKSYHKEWIHLLLIYYYDPPYLRNLEKNEKRIIFKGTEQETYEYISHYFSGSWTR